MYHILILASHLLLVSVSYRSNNDYSKGFWMSQNLCDYPCPKRGDWNKMFSHCFRKTENQQLEFLLSCWFLVWTSLGLNQGPPDYESVALTNWATSPICGWQTCSHEANNECLRSRLMVPIAICECKGTKKVQKFKGFKGEKLKDCFRLIFFNYTKW